MGSLKRVAVALSGGVDSAVTALLLQKKGFDVTGAFIRCWSKTDYRMKSINEDSDRAKAVCNKLKIPFVEIDLIEEYWPQVYATLIADYNIGHAPNPDIINNEQVLFGCFHRYCLNELKMDAVATGHYAKSSFGPFLENRSLEKKARLLRSADKVNDQTYILSRIEQTNLQRTMFPIGELTRNQVIEFAKESNFDRMSDRKETCSSCFLPSYDIKSFVSKYVLGTPGEVIDVDTGKVVGKHMGLHHYLKGDHFKDDYYVADNDEKDCIFVASNKYHPAMFCRSLILSSCHWVSECPINFTNQRLYRASFQYGHDKPLLDCHVVNLFDYPDYGFVFLECNEPLYAVMPGQYVVLYQDDECIGSFKIESTGPCDMFFKTEVQEDQRLL